MLKMIFSSASMAGSKYTSSSPAPSARRVSFTPSCLPGERLEVGGVAPELVLLERIGVVQPHHQRGVDVVEETVEAIADQHRRVPHQIRPLAPVETREDQQRPLLGLFAKAEAALDQRLVHGQQDEPFVVGLEARDRRVINEVAVQDPFLRQTAAFVLIRSHRLDDRLGVGIDELRLEQHPTAELQLPHHAGAGQQAHDASQLVVGEPCEFAGQAQLQRLRAAR